MAKYRVHFVAVASTSVEVIADDPESAIEAAFERTPSTSSIHNNYDMGDWELASDLFPMNNKPEDDYEEVQG